MELSIDHELIIKCNLSRFKSVGLLCVEKRFRIKLSIHLDTYARRRSTLVILCSVSRPFRYHSSPLKQYYRYLEQFSIYLQHYLVWSITLVIWSSTLITLDAMLCSLYWWIFLCSFAVCVILRQEKHWFCWHGNSFTQNNPTQMFRLW